MNLRMAPILVLVGMGFAGAKAAEVIPPAPAAYFNDYAGIVKPATARALNDELEQFERATSNQILVAVYPSMQSDSAIEDYTVRVAQAWGVGQKGRNNGAVLFVFVRDHKLFIPTGYGLESVLPDALCKRIIDEQISPRFRRGDYDGGLSAGVQSMIAAARGEYRGTGAHRGGGPVAVATHRTPCSRFSSWSWFLSFSSAGPSFAAASTSFTEAEGAPLPGAAARGSSRADRGAGRAAAASEEEGDSPEAGAASAAAAPGDLGEGTRHALAFFLSRKDRPHPHRGGAAPGRRTHVGRDSHPRRPPHGRRPAGSRTAPFRPDGHE